MELVLLAVSGGFDALLGVALGAAVVLALGVLVVLFFEFMSAALVVLSALLGV